MPRSAPDPLAGTDLLLVDGSNLLFALRRGAAAPPAAALIGRLRALIPPATSIELYFDGAPEPGMRRQRIAAGLTVRYAAPLSADAAILTRVERLDVDAADRLLVVTDDRELRAALSRHGARTARSDWLLGRLERITLVAPATGNPRPPHPPPMGSGAAVTRGLDRDNLAVGQGGAGRDEPEAGGGWKPGRGATAKRGNARRRPRTRR